jgi:hypothetical protein
LHHRVAVHTGHGRRAEAHAGRKSAPQGLALVAGLGLDGAGGRAIGLCTQAQQAVAGALGVVR